MKRIHTKDVSSAISYTVPGGLALDFVALGPAVVDEKAMTATCVFATDAIDRIGDRITIPGIVTDNHRLAPVVYWNHGKTLDMPIGRTMLDDGTYTVTLGETTASQTTRFSQKLLEAEQIFALIAEKMIWSNSIGYRAIKAKPLYIGGRRAGMDLQSVELLEVSWVGVGCNQEAVRAMLGRKSICGKSLADPLRREFEMFAGPAPVWSPGVDLYAIKSLDESAKQLDGMGDDAQRMDVLADIIGGLLLAKRPATDTKEWRESAHHRGQPGNAGQFGPGGGAAKKPDAATAKPDAGGKPARAARAGGKASQAKAGEAIKTILAKGMTSDSHKELVGHLSALTVPQLHELRKEHGLKCPDRLKAKIIEKLSTHFNAQIIKEGTVDHGKVAAALKPFASVPLDANTSRFAQADYLAIKQQFGSLAVQRIKSIAVDTLHAMKEAKGEERDALKKKMGVCAWMIEQAKRDGITGKVEPASMKDAAANFDRIGLSEKLKGVPWSAFLLRGIRDEYQIDDRVSDEQIFHNLKDVTGSKYKGEMLDNVLRRLRPDYGSMTQEQLFTKVLPKLKNRNDMIGQIATPERPTKPAASPAPAKKREAVANKPAGQAAAKQSTMTPAEMSQHYDGIIAGPIAKLKRYSDAQSMRKTRGTVPKYDTDDANAELMPKLEELFKKAPDLTKLATAIGVPGTTSNEQAKKKILWQLRERLGAITRAVI